MQLNRPFEDCYFDSRQVKHMLSPMTVCDAIELANSFHCVTSSAGYNQADKTCCCRSAVTKCYNHQNKYLSWVVNDFKSCNPK